MPQTKATQMHSQRVTRQSASIFDISNDDDVDMVELPLKPNTRSKPVRTGTIPTVTPVSKRVLRTRNTDFTVDSQSTSANTRGSAKKQKALSKELKFDNKENIAPSEAISHGKRAAKVQKMTSDKKDKVTTKTEIMASSVNKKERRTSSRLKFTSITSVTGSASNGKNSTPSSTPLMLSRDKASRNTPNDSGLGAGFELDTLSPVHRVDTPSGTALQGLHIDSPCDFRNVSSDDVASGCKADATSSHIARHEYNKVLNVQSISTKRRADGKTSVVDKITDRRCRQPNVSAVRRGKDRPNRLGKNDKTVADDSGHCTVESPEPGAFALFDTTDLKSSKKVYQRGTHRITKFKQDRLNVSSRLDEWSEQVNSEFEQIDQYELSIE